MILVALIVSVGSNAKTFWTRQQIQFRNEGINLAVTNIMRSALQAGSITLTVGKTSVILDVRKPNEPNDPNTM